MLLVLNDVAEGIIAREATAWERLASRARASSLDRQLASGRLPETSPLLALRAQSLVRPPHRQSLARCIQRILDDAARPTPRLSPVISPPRRSLNNAADVLTRLVDCLCSPGPVSACGVAKVRTLLSDGTGPLYYPADDTELRASVEEILQALTSAMTW
jgi:hypothetical protein